jgi:crotonobetainyl-CoA:carnitine CoA-transferase CaiB-like acyl-CoA transferase
MGNHDRLMAPHNTYKAAGDADKWVSIAVGSESEWPALCATIGQPELANDPRFQTPAARKANEEALDEIITAWTSSRDRWEVTKALQAAGVAAFPSMSNKDLANDGHLRERGCLVELEHPEVGRRTHIAMPWTVQQYPREVRSPAPLRGADTEAVLCELLGYSAEKIAELRKAGVLN